MEQYTTATTTTGEQIVVQTANGQIQQQVSSGKRCLFCQKWDPLLWGLGIQNSRSCLQNSRSCLFSLSCYDWDSDVLPCLQAQGTVTAVQLQTEAPVVTASGQQVQTLQVVVSPPACVGVMRMLQSSGLHAPPRAVFFNFVSHLCTVGSTLSCWACVTAA